MMNWLIWRQCRTQFIFAAVILVLFAIFAVFTGQHFSHSYHWALTNCGKTNTCSRLSSVLFQGDAYLFTLVTWSSIAVPFILGLFWGAPLIAREYEEGTNKLVWTQSVSRCKWLTIKLVWILSAAAVYGAAFAIIVTWWSQTGNALYHNRFVPFNFDSQGFVPVAHAIFAVALGIAFGAWLKRVLLALAATLGVLLVLQIAVPFLVRPHYMAPLNYSLAVGGDHGDNPSPDGAVWVVSKKQIDYKGHTLNLIVPPSQCVLAPNVDESRAPSKVPAIAQNDGPVVSVRCLTSLGYHWSITYQPAYRYWDFQRIEAVAYLALAALPIATTYWLVLKRDA